jgi:hypothetical protein
MINNQRMKHLLIIATLGVSFFTSNAQEFNYSTKNSWQEVPVMHTVSKEFDSSSAIGILDDRKIEYKVEGKEIYLYTTYHNIIHINDDKGIEMFNKVYVPMYPSAVITGLKARTILPNKKVIEVPKDKIKEIEEDGRKYQLFAMEGVEKGAEVEYMYTTRRVPTYFGMELFAQSRIPYEKVNFLLSVPKHLKFDAKGFNGLKVSSDSVIVDQRIISAYDEKVPVIEDEKYAVRNPYLKRIEYKLSYNLSNAGDVRMYTWKDFAKRVYGTYTTISSKDEKPLNNFMSQVKLAANDEAESKIRAIEDYVKSNINIDKGLIGDNAGEIESIVKRKSADNEGITRLFTGLFDKAGIDYQLVFVGRRDEFPIDEELENWNRIDETLFFFPATGKYIAPTVVELRYPFIPAYWAGTKGLFLKGTSLGNFKTAVGSFGEVKMEPFEKHAINMHINLKFDVTLDTLLINTKQVMVGYGATAYRPYYTFLPQDKQNDLNLEIVKSLAKGTDIKNIKIENALLTDYSDNKPFSISADVKGTELVEKAGSKVLLKIGEIIGQQVEMYQEKPRQLPIELDYPHVLQRTIVFEVPAGYQVKNLQDLNMAIEHKDAGELTMGFVSSYKVEGSKVIVDVLETYKKLTYPISQFEEFKKVINAAADFNKIVLVLEKK